MGRLELLTTETGYLGSSKRKYNFNFNLKSTATDADSALAARLSNIFELNSLPVVGDTVKEGNIGLATRMRPPNVWTIGALDANVSNEKEATEFWLGNPKICVLMNVVHALDNQAFIVPSGGGGEYVPFSYNLVLNFVELENLLNYDGERVSRSEYFDRIGG